MKNDSKRYILTKLVEATPMSKLEYKKHVQNSITKFMSFPSFIKDILSDKCMDEEGYLVNIESNEYWMPKKLFESMTLEMTDNKNLPSSVNIGEEMVDNIIDSTSVIEVGNKTTLLKVILKNGYEIIESSGMVDPANYDVEVGKKACLNKAKKKIWDYLGFMLQTAWNGIK